MELDSLLNHQLNDSQEEVSVAEQNFSLVCKKLRVTKRLKKSESELVQIFWSAPTEALFGDTTVAPVIGCSVKTLQCNRWRGVGIPYRKCGGRVLYRKSDVIAWLEGHALVSSTSQY